MKGLASKAFNVLGLNADAIMAIRKFANGGYGIMTRAKGDRYKVVALGRAIKTPNTLVSRVTEATATFLAKMLGARQAQAKLAPVTIRSRRLPDGSLKQ